MMKRMMIGIAALLALSLGALAYGATMVVTSKFNRTLSADDGAFGGCMGQLDASLRDAGLDCASNWVTFSCSGNASQEAFTNRDDAYRKFDSALMAFALDKRVSVTVTDEMKQGSHCFAKRVDVLKN